MDHRQGPRRTTLGGQFRRQSFAFVLRLAWILRDVATGEVNMDIAWRFRVGDVVKIRLSNDRNTVHAMSHPIHLHGQRFLVLSHDGVANENLVWKDTMLLPVGSTADILLEVTNPGKWMIRRRASADAWVTLCFDLARGGFNLGSRQRWPPLTITVQDRAPLHAPLSAA